MSSRRVDSSTTECIVPGSRIQMPVVQSLASLHSRNASRITWHEHAVFELLFLLDGETGYEFADGESVVVPGGHFLIVPPRVKHRGLHNVRRPARLCSILLDSENENALRNTIFVQSELDSILSKCTESSKLAWPMGGELRRMTSQLAAQVREFESQPDDRSAALRLTVCGTLLEMARQLTTSRTIPPDEAVRAAIAHLESKFDQAISIDDVAQEIGCSRARLFVIFKQSTGQTPNDYLQRIRVNKAAAFLLETDLSVTEIAMNCGFNTSQYFSNVFRKYQNRTPSEARESRTMQ
ncbi:MAG: AraC family transcriptional regulator [Pirellulaceae bacterium]|nr:AraC family transcriptional regulator [Pirellulaceae bacterium]